MWFPFYGFDKENVTFITATSKSLQDNRNTTQPDTTAFCAAHTHALLPNPWPLPSLPWVSSLSEAMSTISLHVWFLSIQFSDLIHFLPILHYFQNIIHPVFSICHLPTSSCFLCLVSVLVGTDPKTVPLRQIPASHIPFIRFSVMMKSLILKPSYFSLHCLFFL